MSYRSHPTDTSKMPSGIPYIISNEAAERFSFYGMKAALAIFLVNYLSVLGGESLSTAKATAYVSFFNSAVYVTPLLGAWIADVYWGKYNTIIKLSAVYCLGHLALAFMGVGGMVQFWLLSGLGLIALGAGGIKPCVSSHVGDQFGKSNQHLLTKVFNIFYLSINFGSVIASLFIPLILKWYGPHWAFGIPGVLMSLATGMFWMGRNKFIHVPPHGSAFYKELKSKEGIAAIKKLIPLFLFVAIFWCLFDQTSSTLVFQAEKMDLYLFGPDSFKVLPSQIQAANPFLILLLIPIFTWGIYPALGKVITLTPLRKIGVGLFLMVVAFLVLSLVQEAIDRGEMPSIWWQLLAYVILTIGEVLVSIVCLEFAYTQAPRKMKSFIMSLYLLSVFAGNAITGAINLYIDVPTVTFAKNETRHAGFDGKLNTSDDLTLKEGDIHSPAYDLLNDSSDAIGKIYQHKKSLPTTLDGAKALASYKDPWGNPLRYTQISSTIARISSDGPDKEHLTQWDLGVLIKINQRNAEDKNTWLYKQKVKKGMLDITSDKEADSLVSTTYYAGGQTKLEGAAYFWFFTILMLVTSILFIPFALTYKTKTYLQE